jgi:hypothetical protein
LNNFFCDALPLLQFLLGQKITCGWDTWLLGVVQTRISMFFNA